MKTRILGKTGLEVSEIGLGGLYISSRGAEFEDAKIAIQEAMALGINYMDTAPAYMDSETVLGKALAEKENSVVLSTKLGGYPKPFNPKDKDQLFKSVEDSLKKLKRDYVDILMIHEPDRPGQYEWWSQDTGELVGPVLEVMDTLKKDGVIHFTGIAGTTAYEMANLIKIGNFDIVLTAFQYSLLWREAAIDILPAAKAKNMGIVIGSPLQHGALAQRFDDEVNNGAKWLNSPRRKQFKELYKLLDETGMSIVEMALRFVLSNPDISTCLVGARSKFEVRSSVEIESMGPLPEEVLSRLDEISNMVPFRPYEEPYNMPFNKNYQGPRMIR